MPKTGNCPPFPLASYTPVLERYNVFQTQKLDRSTFAFVTHKAVEGLGTI